MAPAEGPRALADIHPRMPLMLTPDRWDAWLDPARTDPDDLRELLAPPPGGLMRAYPVVHRRQQRPQQRAGAAEGAGRRRRRAHSSDVTRRIGTAVTSSRVPRRVDTDGR